MESVIKKITLFVDTETTGFGTKRKFFRVDIVFLSLML